MCKPLFVWLLGMMLAGTALGGTLTVAPVFGDGMVLQRDRPVPVWGRADPGSTVVVSFAGQRMETTTDASGAWRLALAPLNTAATGREFTVTAGGVTVTFRDVLVGEVWFCSGQSNMQQEMRHLPPEAPALLAAPLIRQLVSSVWRSASPETAGDFSATAFHFARRIHESFPELPIGLMVAAAGSTAIETWLPLEAFEQLPGAAAKLASARQQDPELKDGGSPSALYRQGVLPVIPYAIRGVIWYQGESNQDDGEPYLPKFQALIDSWRAAWAQEDLPFYYVQLANYKLPSDDPVNFVGYDLVREAQLKALAVVPHTGMAVAIDVGDLQSIHPVNKYDIGRRLALWALAREYGVQNLECSGPLYKGHAVEEGKIRITFDHVGAGLMVGKKSGRDPVVEEAGGVLKRFVICGEDLRWVWADAAIDGEAVLVSSREVPAPIAVRYAMGKNPLGCNLYNRAGLPAAPFRTDTW